MRKIVEVLRLHLKLNLSLRQSATLLKISLDLEQIIHMLRVYTKKQLGFMCES